MTIRTTRSQVTFRSSFMLPGFDVPQPAGTYDVDTDEEVIEGIGRTAYLRVATLLWLRTVGKTEVLNVKPEDLAIALVADQAC